MKPKSIRLYSRAAMLLMMLLTTATAWAQEAIGSIQYNSTGGYYEIGSVDNLNDLAVYVNGTGTYSDGVTTESTAHNCNGLKFKMTADITYTHAASEGDDYAENYTAIGGIFDNTYRYFRGNFDGDGKTVSGIRLRKGGEWYQGLFGVTGTGANVHDVHLTDARISGFKMVGGIVGASYGTLSNCTVTLTDVTASYDIFRGIISGLNTGCPLSHNYYRYCKVNGDDVISGKGCGGADIDDNDGAMPMYVAYIDADGSEAKCFNYTELTGGDTQTLDGSTWYAVTDNIAYTGTLTLTANATIILADGKTLNIGTEDNRISSGSCITGSNYGLTIYGQTNQKGTLNAYNSDYSSPLYVKSYTQHGGTVNVDGTNMHAIWLFGNLTLTRGSLNANGYNHDAISLSNYTVNVSGGTLTATSTTRGIYGKLTMSGGTVNVSAYSGGTSSNGSGAISNNTTVSGGTLTTNAPILGHVTLSGGTTTINGNGFGAIYGDLTLSGTVTVTVTGKVIGTSSRNVIIANGQAFTDGNGHYYTGTLTTAERNAISGQTLTRLIALQLANAADNTTAIGKCNGITGLDITLSGRTLTKDGNWNTLCLPFAVSNFTGTPLEGATVKELLSTSNLDSNGTLTLNFTTVDAIEAGKPYIVRWGTPENNPGTTVVNPVFQGVTITSTTPTAVNFTGGSFVGQYSPFDIVNSGATDSNEGNKDEIILMSTGNRIGYSQNPRTLKCFRCHFYVPANGGQQARSFVLDFGEGETTALTLVNSEKRTVNSDIYDLQGRKVAKPTQGMYIVNGKKIVVK